MHEDVDISNSGISWTRGEPERTSMCTSHIGFQQHNEIDRRMKLEG